MQMKRSNTPRQFRTEEIIQATNLLLVSDLCKAPATYQLITIDELKGYL